ncbi:MAG: A/G-specific adenine glycosylase [Dysgonamonadaceae bacterium]|jgi:A/G-specific adenine glycosylase|nr:A/G-specific adenine glycosylase [Dysgonamonadaceae bacterium]
MNNNPNFFSNKITHWFNANARNLPWRNTINPYRIWISEVILQQTRVAQGLDYYNRFIQRFPDVISLAEADENEVLKYWQGLGYYSRARNLHAAAQQIKTQHNGIFPTDYEQVLALRGVGEYTAAAICSFAYNLPYAVLDGNVYRVLSRVFGIETPINAPKAKKEFSDLAQMLLDTENPSEHNQAIMEFGALQCVPVSPNCSVCPFVEQCVAFSDGMVQKLPVKLKKNSVKERFFNYFFVQQGDYTYLKKREAKDIWKNLYEFPLIETTEKIDIGDLIGKDVFKTMFGDTKLQIDGQPFVVKHVLTHRVIHAAFYMVKTTENVDLTAHFLKIPTSDLHSYPVSRLIELFLEKYFS